jgi:Xaa-Pro dipeptidase
MWDKKRIKQHKRAAFLLNKIKDEAFAFISQRARPAGGGLVSGGVSEWQVHEFILGQYEKYGLVTAGNKTIVAFGKNTRHIHYYPSQSKTFYLLQQKDPAPGGAKVGPLVMLDIWARLREPGAPYADITWMGYVGRNVPREIQKVFDVVIGARDECLEFIKAHAKWPARHASPGDAGGGILPTGKEADSVARNYIARFGFEKTFRHSTGHGLGFSSPHWRGRNLSERNKYALLPNIGYTIEPGIYMSAEVSTKAGLPPFGCRSEINFYIDEKMNVIVTTPMQKKIQPA